MAGYAETPLLQKLGYQPHDSVYTLQAPAWFTKLLNDGNITTLPATPATWTHGFFTELNELKAFLEKLELNDIEKGLWVSWPKKSSSITTELTEQTFRDEILPLGWVDTKVCAIDDTWSGLKFLRRKT